MAATKQNKKLELQLIGQLEIDKLLKKASAAVHLYPESGDYTLFVRRVFNVLLALTWAQWKSRTPEEHQFIRDNNVVVRFKAPVGELRRGLGLDRTDHGNDRIYVAMDHLRERAMRFNIMREEGWFTDVASLIGQWGRGGGGLVTWQFMPDVLRLLLEPVSYAKVDLCLGNQFATGAALALYENTVRYATNPGLLTGRLPVQEWIKLLVGPKKYQIEENKNAYSDFKRFVLNGAMKELAASHACPHSLELIEHRAGRRVVELQFKLIPKYQGELPFDAGFQGDDKLCRALIELGISRAKAQALLITHESDTIRQYLLRLEQRQEEGPLRNPAGYFMTLVSTGAVEQQQAAAAAAQAADEAEALAALQNKRRREFERHREDRARLHFASLSAEDKADRKEAFAAFSATAYPTMGLLKRKSSVEESLFFQWYAQQDGVLRAPEERDFAEYLLWAQIREAKATKGGPAKS